MEKNFELKEIQDKAFDLCLAIYRLVKYFPEGEVLISQIKELANELTANILLLGKTEKISIKEINWQLEKINVFLRIAGTQGWLNPINFDFLMQGYGKIKDELNKFGNDFYFRDSRLSVALRSGRRQDTSVDSTSSLQVDSTSSPQTGSGQASSGNNKKGNSDIIRNKSKAKNFQLINQLNLRQKKIIDFMKKKKEAKMNDLQGIFKGEVTERTLRNDLQGLVAQKLIKSEGEFKTRKYYIKN